MTGIAGAIDYKPPDDPDVCWVCGGGWKKGGASFAAKAGAAFPRSLNPPPCVQVCDAACADDPRFSDPHASLAAGLEDAINAKSPAARGNGAS